MREKPRRIGMKVKRRSRPDIRPGNGGEVSGERAEMCVRDWQGMEF